MKALLYKEFKLAMHPLCYVFVFAFPLMILIPSYPIAIGFIYVLSCYPIIFLGANKGQQSNDLLYSALLPVRKKDIVKARIFTIAIMQFVFMIVMSCLYPLAVAIHNFIISSGGEAPEAGLGLNAYVSVLAIVLIGYAISDLIFFPIYYKKGKAIVSSTLFMILGFVLYILVLTVIFPYIQGFEGYTNFLSGNIGIQFALLGGALVIYVLLHFLVYKISSKRLEKVDF